MRAVTHAFALGLYRWVPTEGSCNGFSAFYASVQLSVTHTAGLEDRRYCGKGLRERKGWRR